MRERIVAVVGDANHPRAWSGIPFFFLKAGKRSGLFTGGLSLEPARLRRQRLFWNALQPLRLRRPGGFQYSETFLRQLIAQDPPSPGAEVISHFPLLPPRPWASGSEVSFYIDATLHQNFEDYGLGRILSRRLQREVLARERDMYQAARWVVCMSPWAARSVSGDYGVPDEKIRIICPGANIDEEALATVAPQLESVELRQPLQLGFIGKDWDRKGLRRLLRAVNLLAARGISAEVPVIGHTENTLPAHPALRPLGFFDKARDMGSFVAAVRRFHFGCLLSSVEALGISTLECLRLGVPAIGTAVGGIPGSIPEGAGFYVSLDRAAEQLADRLEELVCAPAEYMRMRKRVQEYAAWATWDRVLAEFGLLFGQPSNTQSGGASPVSSQR